MNPRTIRRLKTVIMMGLSGLVIGPIFASLAFGFAGYRLIKGMVVGVLITAISAAMELFVFEEGLRRVRFLWSVIIRSVFYFLLITVSTTLVVLIHESLKDRIGIVDVLAGNDFRQFLRGDFITILVFAIVVSFSLNFLWQMNRLLGKGVLLNYVTGRYHTPRQEERIFMFLDLKASTSIAEEIPPEQYHNLLNDYFFDINEPILSSKGEIYQYVGDEVVISWCMQDGIHEGNCLQCFFRIKEKIEQERERYVQRYGVAPEFKAGLHCGRVIIGEIGDARKEIVIHGDVMNTASRIQSQCNSFGETLLVSQDVLEKISVKDGLHFVPLGKIRLKGKQNEVELYGVRRQDQGADLRRA